MITMQAEQAIPNNLFHSRISETPNDHRQSKLINPHILSTPQSTITNNQHNNPAEIKYRTLSSKITNISRICINQLLIGCLTSSKLTRIRQLTKRVQQYLGSNTQAISSIEQITLKVILIHLKAYQNLKIVKSKIIVTLMNFKMMLGHAITVRWKAPRKQSSIIYILEKVL